MISTSQTVMQPGVFAFPLMLRTLQVIFDWLHNTALSVVHFLIVPKRTTTNLNHPHSQGSLPLFPLSRKETWEQG